MTTTAVGYHLMARLTGPQGLDRLEDLVREEYTLGRGDPTRVIDFAVPEDEYLSRVHCRLLKAGETYAVENLSPNGTRVNGKVITKVTALKHKDRVEAGGMTVLEFLALSDEERAKELTAGTPGAAEKKKAVATKPFTKRPIFWALIGFYGLIGVVAMAAINRSEPAPAVDPGAGPYFRWMMKAPLLWDADEAHRKDVADRMWEDKGENTPADVRDQITSKLYDKARLRERIPENKRRVKADEKWAEALAEHGGPAIDQGPHAYYLIDAALEVLGFRGFATLKAALDAKDPVAVMADEALHGKDGTGGLEGRMRELYIDATRYGGTGLWRLARERCQQIIDAVPDRYVPVRQWAAERLGAPPRR